MLAFSTRHAIEEQNITSQHDLFQVSTHVILWIRLHYQRWDITVQFYSLYSFQRYFDSHENYADKLNKNERYEWKLTPLNRLCPRVEYQMDIMVHQCANSEPVQLPSNFAWECCWMSWQLNAAPLFFLLNSDRVFLMLNFYDSLRRL